MKKLLTATILATTIGTATAAPIITTGTNTYSNHHIYHNGYHDGKAAAYNNVARTAVIVGFAVIAGVVIYKLGQNSRWITNERGVAYRF